MFALDALSDLHRLMIRLSRSPTQITHLTNQKDADRLTLLKEVAGTKVYEERRAESNKIMDESSACLSRQSARPHALLTPRCSTHRC